jgi:hypothetical protein
MKRLYVFSALSAILLFFSNCKKGIDHGGGAASHYAIQSFIAGSDSLFINYNNSGDPVSVLRQEPSTGSPDFLFRYDSRGRLSEMIAAYGPEVSDGAEHWDFFFYLVVNGKPELAEWSPMGTITYGYDSRDRITSVTTVFEGVTIWIRTYSYNNAGNRTGATYYNAATGTDSGNVSAFDNKTNFRQTSSVWQFLGEDYSVNNPLNATYTYNSAGLPLSIDGPATTFIYAISGTISNTNVKIHYYSH